MTTNVGTDPVELVEGMLERLPIDASHATVDDLGQLAVVEEALARRTLDAVAEMHALVDPFDCPDASIDDLLDARIALDAEHERLTKAGRRLGHYVAAAFGAHGIDIHALVASAPPTPPEEDR